MLEKTLLMEMYRRMARARIFDETVAALFASGGMHGTCHLSIGEEATAAGSVFALERQDQVIGTHRSHAQAIAFGMDVKRMMAEIFGKQTGYCKGKGGSMHIADIQSGFLGANGIVGGGLPLATGAALAIKLRKQADRVVLCFFGDGASNEGAFHESLNMASLYKLPVIYACINNQYGMSTHITRSMGEPDIQKRAYAYGISGVTVDGNDAIAVYEAVRQARGHVLSSGPMLLVQNTYRTCGHSKSDNNCYRPLSEIEQWKARCPLRLLEEKLRQSGMTAPHELEQARAEAEQAIREAISFARSSPDPTPDDLLADVFA